MPTVKLVLDKRAKKADETYPIKIYLYHKGTIHISTGISIKESDWNGDELHPTAIKRINGPLVQMLTQARSLIYQLRADGKLNAIGKSELKRAIESGGDSIGDVNNQTDAEEPLISEYFQKLDPLHKTEGTRSVYNQTLRKLAKYYDMGQLRFADVNLSWLRSFEAKMRNDGMTYNALSIHIRNLRSVFNRAIDDEVIDQNCYPFRKFKIKHEPTKKRYLTIDQLRILRDYPVETYQEKYRDMFMLMFYLVGINAVDLFHLKESDICNGRIEYVRAKTNKLYNLKIEPEAMNIIKRYQGKEYLLNVLDDYKNHLDFLHRMNLSLKSIGPFEMIENKAKNPTKVKKNKKQVSPLFLGLSSYWTRHTWATLAADLDIPDETISMALGHSGPNKTTNIYINRNLRKIDEANRKVIDYLNGDLPGMPSLGSITDNGI